MKKQNKWWDWTSQKFLSQKEFQKISNISGSNVNFKYYLI